MSHWYQRSWLPAGASHFPGDADGWSGYHPADGNEALSLLDDAIAKGAMHLLIPSESFWWLDFYTEFAERLERRHHMVERPLGVGSPRDDR